jgi:hypothetical protein
MTIRWKSETITIVWSPWWSWSVDAKGDYVQMGTTLACGHQITATSRTSQSQLVQNYRRMTARHVGHPAKR